MHDKDTKRGQKRTKGDQRRRAATRDTTKNKAGEAREGEANTKRDRQEPTVRIREEESSGRRKGKATVTRCERAELAPRSRPETRNKQRLYELLGAIFRQGGPSVSSPAIVQECSEGQL